MPSQFCRSSPQAEVSWAPLFSFPVVLQRWGLRLGYNIHRCPVSSPHPQSIVWPPLSALSICARPVPIIHLVLQVLDHFVTYTEWEQITPTLLPLCWPGLCKVSAQGLSSPIEKSLSGHCYLSEPLMPPFDQSVRHPKWEQIMPTLFPLCWLGCCQLEVPVLVRSLHSGSVSVLRKIPLGAMCCFKQALDFPHSPTL